MHDPSDGAHEVRFRFGQDEMARVLWRSAYGRGFVLGGTAAMSVAAVALMAAGGLALLFGLMLAFFVLVSPVSVWKQSLGLAAAHPAVRGEVTLRFDARGLRSPDLAIVGTLAWSTLALAEEDGRYWFVRATEPPAMIVLPKRAFAAAQARALRGWLPGAAEPPRR